MVKVFLKKIRQKWHADIIAKLEDTFLRQGYVKEPVPHDFLDKDIFNFNKICYNIASMETCIFCLSNLPAYLPPALVSTAGEPSPQDENLVKRLIMQYAEGNKKYSSEDGGFWGEWGAGIKRGIHEALLAEDLEKTTDIVRNPAKNVLFWGFDGLVAMPETYMQEAWELDRFGSKLSGTDFHAWLLCDALLNLAVAVGAVRMEYPEAGIPVLAGKANFDVPLNVDALLDTLEAEMGISLAFPNPFAGETGLASKRGVISYRALGAVYQAWRIAQLGRGNSEFKVLEIGAGLGRTAYYAHLFGIRNYTIVDIPMTNVAQGYFLGRVLGEDAIRLGTETHGAENGLRILSTSDFMDHEESYDLVFNCDSLTEMPRTIAQAYWDFARKSTRCFLSINHEINEFTFKDMYSNDNDVIVERHPYPLRRGYVEELARW